MSWFTDQGIYHMGVLNAAQGATSVIGNQELIFEKTSVYVKGRSTSTPNRHLSQGHGLWYCVTWIFSLELGPFCELCQLSISMHLD